MTSAKFSVTEQILHLSVKMRVSELMLQNIFLTTYRFGTIAKYVVISAIDSRGMPR